MFYVKLFGAPAFTWRDEPFDLARRQARALLFRLAADDGPVPRSQLFFLFWPDLDDRKARQNLTRLLSFVRGALPEPGLLVVNRDNIALDHERCASDRQRFQRQLQNGDDASLTVAADLYQGDFLAGFDLPGAVEYENWLLREQNRYQRLYLEALAKLVDLRSTAGDQQAAIDFAQRYLAVDDLAEEMHRQLITLHGRTGDRAAAQRQYEACLTVLERELGVDPLPETQAAFQAVLVDEPPLSVAEPDVAAVEPTWNILPSLDLPLIGREESWRQLEQAYGKYESGGFIFIAGQPGVGKSRLLQEFAAGIKDRLVLTGNSHRGSRNLPYHPIVQALRQTLVRPDLWQGIPAIWLAETRTILPELGDLFADLPQPMPVEPGQAQARLYEALRQIVFFQAGQQPQLLCLDDIHWADEATLHWLEYLARSLPGSQLCIMATYRTQRAQSLVDLRQILRRGDTLANVTLTGLSVDAISAILNESSATSGQRPTPVLKQLAATIHQATSGNAYFVLETIRTLIEGEQLDDPPSELPLPTTVREVIESRLARLDPLARQMIEAAAVLQPDLSRVLLARTAGRSEDEQVDALEQLVGRQMMQSTADGFDFQHDLLRNVVYDGLTVWRRRMLHRRAAEALADLPDVDRREMLARIAGHYEVADEARRAVLYYDQAARLAQDQHAHREAGSLARHALQLLPKRDADPAVKRDLLELLADSLTATGQFNEAETIYRQALAEPLSTTPSSPIERVRQAELIRKLAAALKALLHHQEADQLFDRALTLLADLTESSAPARRSWLRCQLDRLDLFYLLGRVDEMALLAAEIEPVIVDLEDPYYTSIYYRVVTQLRIRQERYRLSPETVRLVRERLAYTIAAGDPREAAEQRFGLGFTLLWAGELEESIDNLEVALDMAEELDHPFLQVRCLTYLGILFRLRRDPARVQHYLQRSEQFTGDDKYRYYVGADHAARAWLACLDDDWPKALAEAQLALEMWDDKIYVFGWLAYWILMAHDLHADTLEYAGQAAAAMLSPHHQGHSVEMTAALEEVVRAEESGDLQALRSALRHSLDLARAAGYL